MLLKMIFGFPKVKWLHLTGEADKSVRFSWQIFSGFNTPKITSRCSIEMAGRIEQVWHRFLARRLLSTYPTRKFRYLQKILPSGTLPQTPHLENFADS